MTTAARPTFNPAMGGHTGRDLGYISQIRSSKELPGYKTLKLRQRGQNSAQEIKARDLKSELQQAEREFRAKKRKLIGGSGGADDDDMDEDADGSATLGQPSRSADTDDDYHDDHSSRRRAPKRPRHADHETDDPDADLAVSDDDGSHADSDDNGSRSGSDSDDDDGDDSEDETEALMRELEKIKRERAEERERQEAAKRAEEEEALMAGNPLLNLGRGALADFSIKKRWDDDVVFKNQARTEEKPVRRFINDTIRSDFHRKFLHKYVR
ncbi:hypothetical protein GGF31_007124 [Allomyces arbusculus]|nr:hypothetical protein GGF31_007124 [Allomyces arbusculus]